MSTSPIFTLSELKGDSRIPVADLSYMRTRNRHRLYNLIIDEFERSGLSQADLARRLGKKPEVVCRWLAMPGNWQSDTVSDLLFAINGAEASYKIAYPLQQAARNDSAPEWLYSETAQQDALVKKVDLRNDSEEDQTASSDTVLVFTYNKINAG